MTRLLTFTVFLFCRAVALLVLGALVSVDGVYAQGVTTAAVTGVVKDDQGAVIPGATVTAIHQPSGSSYETVTQGDGRFFIPGMRVGGPYKVTGSLTGFTSAAKDNVTLSLGVTQDLEFTLKVAAIAETVTVIGESSPVFSSTRTGAATAVSRDELAALPTISGRINDFSRLSPQYSGSGTFAGPGQPGEQHHSRRLVLQRLVRPRTTPGLADAPALRRCRSK